MDSRTILQFSPVKSSLSAFSTPGRAKTPSPEKNSQIHTILIISHKRERSPEDNDSSPSKKTRSVGGESLVQQAQFETVFAEDDTELRKVTDRSKHIKLSESLIHDGRAQGPGDDSQRKELSGLFPAAKTVMVVPPFVVLGVNTLPSKPWPLTIGGLPLHFTTAGPDWRSPIMHGRIGKANPVLNDMDLSKESNLKEHVLSAAAKAIIDIAGSIIDIFWWAGVWTITIPNGTEMKLMPVKIGRALVFYKEEKEQLQPDLMSLRKKAPAGVDFDDSAYDGDAKMPLRPGVMLASSSWDEQVAGDMVRRNLSTSSGILVADAEGQQYITAAAHGFKKDGQVWHPKPDSGRLIGTITSTLPDSDIALVKLAPGIHYVNTAFGSDAQPDGVQLTTIIEARKPALKIFDSVFMNNPFSGFCEGQVLGYGYKTSDGPADNLIGHQWVYFQNGDAPIDGSCGSPLWNEDGEVSGFFRYQLRGEVNMALAVAAEDLKKSGYSLVSGDIPETTQY